MQCTTTRRSPWSRRLAAVICTAVVLSVPRAGAAPPAAATLEGFEAAEEAPPDYDPWEPFNERMFSFNHDVLDRYLLKPIATVWDRALPDPVQHHLAQAFDNADMPARLVNNLLQRRFEGAGREVGRFLVNTTVGLAGLFDVAGRLHIQPSSADAGQTLGLYGVGAGPYLVLPFLPPLTIRDGVGRAIDGALDPLGYLFPLPLAANAGITAGRTVNDRSLNLQLFDDVEESVLDLYSAARNAYLQRRRHAIDEARGR